MRFQLGKASAAAKGAFQEGDVPLQLRLLLSPDSNSSSNSNGKSNSNSIGKSNSNDKSISNGSRRPEGQRLMIYIVNNSRCY